MASFQGSFLWCKSRLTAHFITFRVEVGEKEVLFLTKDFPGYSSLHIYFGASSCSWKGQHMFRCTFLVDALKEEIRHIVALVLLKSSTSCLDRCSILCILITFTEIDLGFLERQHFFGSVKKTFAHLFASFSISPESLTSSKNVWEQGKKKKIF